MMRTWSTAALLLAGLLGEPLVAAAQQAGPLAEVALRPARERTLDRPDHPGHLFREQEARFNLGRAAYTIAYKACVDPAHEGKVAPLEGYIGMPAPASSNWYHSGFLFIRLNDKDIGTTPLHAMLVAQRGERAILDMVWQDEIADVRVRFLGLPDRDHLYCEVALEPKQDITSIMIELRCYPSFFTSWHKRDGARRIRTPAMLIEQGQSATVSAADNWSAVYYDEVFDVARGEGEGPCAMLLVPDEANEVTFSPGSYAVDTRISFAPEARSLRFAFWDFKGLPNAEALARISDAGAALREELAALDFTPAAVAAFDVAAVKAELERALQSEVARETLGDRLVEVQTWLERYAPALEERPDVASIEAETHLLRSIDRYHDFMWEVRLAELISDL